MLDVPDWAGHRAGQHLDVRLTAEDGYRARARATRSRRRRGSRIAITVERLDDGEVSPYLADELLPGDEIELRGPVGGYFVWEPERRRPAAARRWRLGRRAAARDRSGIAAPSRQRRPGAAALLLALARGRHLPGRARRRATAVDVVHTLTRAAAAGLDGSPAPRRRRAARRGRLAGGRSDRWRTSAGRRASSRRSPPRSSGSATTPARIKTERFGAREARMMEPLDGNAIAGTACARSSASR